MRDMEPENEAAWLAAIDRNLQLWIDNLGRTVVAELDTVVVGYEMWSRTGTTSTLVTLNVSVDFRGRGLGAQLLQRFGSDAIAAGAGHLELGVHSRNRARRLYEAAGYRQVGVDGDYLLYELPHGSLRSGAGAEGLDSKE